MQHLTGTGINIILSIIIIVYLIKIDNCSCIANIKNEKKIIERMVRIYDNMAHYFFYFHFFTF